MSTLCHRYHSREEESVVGGKTHGVGCLAVGGRDFLARFTLPNMKLSLLFSPAHHGSRAAGGKALAVRAKDDLSCAEIKHRVPIGLGQLAKPLAVRRVVNNEAI